MDDSAAFFNRDLSWLEFNDRVLAQAERADLPLLERVKFFAIYSSNLDEFFQKRVGLIKARLAHPATRDRLTHEGLTLTELLTQIRGLVVGQQSRQAELWEGGLVPALEAEGIGVRKYADLKKPARKKLDAWFDGNVFSVLTPLAVDPSHRFPFISNLSENFGLVLTRNADPQDRVFARVKIPGVVSRFVPVPDDEMQSYVALDDLMAHNLDRLFPGLTIQDVAPFRVTRSAAVAGMEDDDEIDDVLQHVEDELRRRRFAAAVRVEAPPDAPPNVLEFVTGQLGLEAEDLYLRAGPLEHQDLFELASLPRPDLKLTPWTPVIPKALRDLTPLEDEDDPVVRVVGGRGRPCRVDLRTHPAGGHPAAPPVRELQVLGGAVRGRGGGRPRCARDQADDLSHEPGLAVRAVADPRGGRGQERGVPCGAAGPVRRGAERRVRKAARTRGRARRLRRGGAEDPLQVQPRGPARAARRGGAGRRGTPGLCAHRHGQLPPQDRAALHRPGAADGRPGADAGCRPGVQHADRSRRRAGLRAAAGGPADHAVDVHRARRARDRERGGAASPRGSSSR